MAHLIVQIGCLLTLFFTCVAQSQDFSFSRYSIDDVIGHLDNPSFSKREAASREIFMRIENGATRSAMFDATVQQFYQTESPEVYERSRKLIEKTFKSVLPAQGAFSSDGEELSLIDIDPNENWIAYKIKPHSEEDVGNVVALQGWDAEQQRPRGEPVYFHTDNRVIGLFFARGARDRLVVGVEKKNLFVLERNPHTREWIKTDVLTGVPGLMLMKPNALRTRAAIASLTHHAFVDLNPLRITRVFEQPNLKSRVLAFGNDTFLFDHLRSQAFLIDGEGNLTKKFYGLSGRISSRSPMQFMPDPRRLIIAAANHTFVERLRNPNAETWNSMTEMKLPGSLSFAPSTDGEFLALGDSSGVVTVVELATGTFLHRSRADHRAIHSLRFSSDNRSLFAAADERLHWINLPRVLRRDSILGAPKNWVKNSQHAWQLLAAPNSADAYRGIGYLIDDPTRFDDIVEHLKPFENLPLSPEDILPLTNPDQIQVKRILQILRAKLKTPDQKSQLWTYLLTLKTNTFLHQHLHAFLTQRTRP